MMVILQKKFHRLVSAVRAVVIQLNFQNDSRVD